MDRSPKFSPVVAIDIDGVLRIRDGDEVPGAFSREITFHRDEYPTLFHGRPRWNDDGTAGGDVWFSGVGAAWVRGLVDQDIHVVLATTWQRWANTYFAGALGLPELPVAVRTPESEELVWYHCSPDWKSDQLARQFDGRPLMWVDDNRWDRPSENLIEARLPADRALTYFHEITHPWAGITETDVAEMDEWLARASTTDGHAWLRAERRRLRQRDARAAGKWRKAHEERMRAIGWRG